MIILPALWLYIGAIIVKVDKDISRVNFKLRVVLLPRLITCWNYKVMGSQRSYLEELIDDRDDAGDEYWSIRDAVDAVDTI